MAMRGVGSVSAVMAMMAVVMMVVASTSAYGITRFQGSISNSWLLTTTTSVLVIDAQSSHTDGLALAAKLSSFGFSTQPTILITHGHPDHFYGLPAVMSVFPGAQVFVASQQVKDSIIADVASSGSATPSDVANFDFADVLQISGEDFQAVGATFKVISGFLDTEAPIETVIADDQTQSLFTGDVLYVSTHLYLGPPLTTQWLENWIAAQEGLAERYATYTVYPGHGPSSSNIARVASDNTDYIHYFVSQLCAARSLTDVPNNMVAHYPTYDGAAFTSFILNNTAWATYRTQNCSSASTLASPLALVALVSTIVACVLAAF